MMISTTQMLYCLVSGGVYLVLISLLLEFLSRSTDLTKGIPPVMVEKITAGWWVLLLVMEFLFYVAIPTVSYSFFYLVVPFSGVRAGLAATLYAFVLGAVPMIMALSVRVKFPMPYLLFLLLGFLLKLGGALAIIGYLYTL